MEQIKIQKILKKTKNFKDIHLIDNYLYSIILILIIFMICLESGLQRGITVDFLPINGDFQNYNVWRRLLDGQVPFKDFPVYLGIGHLLTGSILTGALGNTFKISLIVSHFLTVAISAMIISTIAYLILRNLKASLTLTVTILILVRENFTWCLNIIYSEFWSGLNSLFYPGNSARIIRSGVVAFVIWSVLLFLLITEKKLIYMEEVKKFLIQVTFVSSISGIGMLYSNDIGISSYICFSFTYFLFLIKKFKFNNWMKIAKYTIYYILISILSLFLVVFLITHGNIGSWLEFTFSAGQYQRWYYGNSEYDKSYFIHQLAFSPLSYMAIFIIFYNIYMFFKDKNSKDYIFRAMIIYILLTGLLSSNIYRIMSGGVSVELLSLTTFVVILSYFCKYSYHTFILNKEHFPILKVMIIIFSLSFSLPRMFTTYNNYISNNNMGVYVDGLDGYLTKLYDDINNVVEYTGKKEVFSTYASAVETVKGNFQPTGTDYIIHVLGDNARKEYVNKFLDGNYEYVQTINRDYTAWELWAESSNWFFYKELYKKYVPTLTTSYSIIWEPAEQDNIIDTKVNINIEKLSEHSYKVVCSTNLDIDAMVDVSLEYTSNFTNGILHNGVFGKYVHITDTTRNDIYNDGHVNYFIPSNSEAYNIPITLRDGIGEIIISSYPNEETKLNINGIKVNDVIKSPFNFPNLQASNLTDNNWEMGINKYTNTILFSNNSYNNIKLKNAVKLKSDNIVANIKSIQIIDNWIHVSISGDKTAFSYPNNIEVITK